jgi:pimeloyl-ACP methyl ester carboxylesterase
LAALLDGLGIEPTALTGASMGGRVAIDFALAYPDRVDRLLLISPGLADWDWSDICGANPSISEAHPLLRPNSSFTEYAGAAEASPV